MTPGAIASWVTPERRRFLRFCAVGSSGVLVNLAFVWVGTLLAVAASLEPGSRDAAASALGILVSVFGNFLLNDVWTWGDRPKGPRKRDFLARAGRYYLASALAIAIQFGCAQLLAQGFGVNLYLAQCVGIILGTLVNYAANNVWTFSDS